MGPPVIGKNPPPGRKHMGVPAAVCAKFSFPVSQRLSAYSAAGFSYRLQPSHTGWADQPPAVTQDLMAYRASSRIKHIPYGIIPFFHKHCLSSPAALFLSICTAAKAAHSPCSDNFLCPVFSGAEGETSPRRPLTGFRCVPVPPSHGSAHPAFWQTVSSLPTTVTHFLALVTAVYRRFRFISIRGPLSSGRITAGYSLPWDLCMVTA